jgi:hypothetical protein
MLVALHYNDDSRVSIQPILRASVYLQSVGITLLDKGSTQPEPKNGIYFAVQQGFLTEKVVKSQTLTVQIIAMVRSATRLFDPIRTPPDATMCVLVSGTRWQRRPRQLMN